MVQFKSPQESHKHSREVLDILYGYDTFLDSLEVVADMGCGRGLDTFWWATLETRDDPPEPRNYRVYAVDKNEKLIDNQVKELENVTVIAADFETLCIPRKIDLIWSHDSFQYVTNPLGTLKIWNQMMNENGMIALILPQSNGYEYNRFVNRGYNNSYFNHNLINLVYMLAVNGFDCNDAYAKKEENNLWLHFAAYKSSIAPMNPTSTSWYDLADAKLIHPSFVESLNKWGYIKQEDIFFPWLDKDIYREK